MYIYGSPFCPGCLKIGYTSNSGSSSQAKDDGRGHALTILTNFVKVANVGSNKQFPLLGLFKKWRQDILCKRSEKQQVAWSEIDAKITIKVARRRTNGVKFVNPYSQIFWLNKSWNE